MKSSFPRELHSTFIATGGILAVLAAVPADLSLSSVLSDSPNKGILNILFLKDYLASLLGLVLMSV